MSLPGKEPAPSLPESHTENSGLGGGGEGMSGTVGLPYSIRYLQA